MRKKQKRFRLIPGSYIIENNGAICSSCEDGTPLVYTMIDTDEQLCPDCFLSIHRPRMEFIKNKLNPMLLYNVDSGEYEADGLTHFVGCGWFVREKIIARNVPNLRVVITYILEYYGEKACPRCNVEFSEGAPKCVDAVCAAIGNEDPVKFLV